MWVSIALWVWVLITAMHQTAVHHKMQHAMVALPGGKIATTQQKAEGLNVVSHFARPGDAVFQAAQPAVYLPLRVHNPLSFDTANSTDMPRPSDVRLAIRQLEKQRVPYVLWSALLDSSCSLPCNDRLTPLRDYLHSAYVPVATLPDGDTLWRRRE